MKFRGDLVYVCQLFPSWNMQTPPNPDINEVMVLISKLFRLVMLSCYARKELELSSRFFPFILEKIPETGGLRFRFASFLRERV